MPVLADPRQQAIARLLAAGGQAVVSELAKRFGVSEMTIRRDLRTLEGMGLAVRVHGGALPGERTRFKHRLAANARDKARAVAKLVGGLPREGCVYFDGSTTVLNLVRRLKGLTGLQVATNNVETFNRLAAARGPAPILIGGSLDRRTDNLIGPLAVRSIEGLAFAAAYFSARGLAGEVGLSEVTVEDALVKGEVAKRSRRVAVAVDHSKLGVAVAGVWNHDRDRTVLATDLNPEDGRLAEVRGMFTEVV